MKCSSSFYSIADDGWWTTGSWNNSSNKKNGGPFDNSKGYGTLESTYAECLSYTTKYRNTSTGNSFIYSYTFCHIYPYGRLRLREKMWSNFFSFFLKKRRRLAIFIDGKNKNLSMTGALHFSVYTVRKIQPNDRMRAEKEEEGKRYHSQGMAMYKKGERERKEGQISEMIREFINRKRRAVRQPPTRVDMTFEKRIIAKPLLLLLLSSSSSSSLYTIYDI